MARRPATDTTLYVVAVDALQNNSHGDIGDVTNRPAYGTFDDIAHARRYQQEIAGLQVNGKPRRVRLFKTNLNTMEEM